MHWVSEDESLTRERLWSCFSDAGVGLSLTTDYWWDIASRALKAQDGSYGVVRLLHKKYGSVPEKSGVGSGCSINEVHVARQFKSNNIVASFTDLLYWGSARVFQYCACCSKNPVTSRCACSVISIDVRSADVRCENVVPATTHRTPWRLKWWPWWILYKCFGFGMSQKYEICSGNNYNLGLWHHCTVESLVTVVYERTQEFLKSIAPYTHAWSSHICSSCRHKVVIQRSLVSTSITLDASISHSCGLVNRYLKRHLLHLDYWQVNIWATGNPRFWVFSGKWGSGSVVRYGSEKEAFHFLQCCCFFVRTYLPKAGKRSRESGVALIREHARHGQSFTLLLSSSFNIP